MWKILEHVCIWSARERHQLCRTMRISKNPTTVMTANGDVQTREEATVYVKELDGSSAKIMGIPTTGTSGRKPQLIKNGRKINCNTRNHSYIFITKKRSASTRSENMSEEVQGTRRVDQQKPKTHIKMTTTKNYEVNYCKMCRMATGFQGESGG